jgi:Rieske 2Fe-2S family protein
VHEDAEEGVDYDVGHLTDVWRVTNAEDVGLCNSMTQGARSSYYRPGRFAPDEQFCMQFCDWYMRHSN